jgi:hypothetical protein
LLDDEAALGEAVEPGIELLLTTEIPDIDLLTEQIDAVSRVFLSPDEASPPAGDGEPPSSPPTPED